MAVIQINQWFCWTVQDLCALLFRVASAITMTVYRQLEVALVFV